MYFILDNLTNYSSNDFKGLILHELSVHFGKDILTDTEWRNVKSVMLDLYVKGDTRIVKAMNESTEKLGYHTASDIFLAKKAFLKSKPLQEDPSLDLVFEEALAYFAQFNADTIQTGATKGIWTTIQQAVRRFFTKLA